mmetsp:Transcript_24873/g.63009  ORF Transcript_24873/g.63009 Transcript_24873/m.63009 type:complete len:242 (+) Transcript_24873:168-893(+)
MCARMVLACSPSVAALSSSVRALPSMKDRASARVSSAKNPRPTCTHTLDGSSTCACAKKSAPRLTCSRSGSSCSASICSNCARRARKSASSALATSSASSAVRRSGCSRCATKASYSRTLACASAGVSGVSGSSGGERASVAICARYLSSLRFAAVWLLALRASVAFSTPLSLGAVVLTFLRLAGLGALPCEALPAPLPAPLPAALPLPSSARRALSCLWATRRDMRVRTSARNVPRGARS